MLQFLKRHKEQRQQRQEAARRASEAEQMGRDAAAAMTGAVDQFMKLRARPTAERVWGVFIQRLDEVRGDTEQSPVDLVRIEAQIFVEELGRFQERMTADCKANVDEWLRLADEMELRDVLEGYIANQVAGLFLELFERSVNHAGDLVSALKTNGHKAILTAD